MLRQHIVISLSLMIISAAALEAQKTSADRIKGCFVAAGLGDALARNTMPFDTFKEIQDQFGISGISSVSQIAQEDLADSFGTEKKALYSGNTAQSLMVALSLAEARRTSLEKEFMADLIAKRLIKMLDEESRFLDPYFNQRYYMSSLIEKTDTLVDRSLNRVGKAWWVNSSLELKDEADSTALTRAWPVGLVFADAPISARYLADYLSTITHRHPKARAAATAMVAGITLALEDSSIDEIVRKMVTAAEYYEEAERQQKARQKKPKFEVEEVREEMLTSQLIRFAANAAREKTPLAEVLGTNNKRNDENRSFRGYLLGYQADEAVAAAVYLFVKNPTSLKGLIGDGSLAVGNSALITSLAAALYGAHNGYDQIIKEGYQDDISSLESKEQLFTAAADIYRSLSYQPLEYEKVVEPVQQKKPLVAPVVTHPKEPVKSLVKLNPVRPVDATEEQEEKPASIFTLRNAAIVGGLVLGGYLIKEYVIPYVQNKMKQP